MALHHSAAAVSASKRTVLLVHGAWHGSWCWQRLGPELERRGLAVATLDLPSVHERLGDDRRALSADAAAVRRTLDALPGPVILLGHSYGGMVISLAAHGAQVAQLVYLCAFVPGPGESLIDLAPPGHASFVRALEDGRTIPDAQQAPAVFYGDCDADTQRWACAQLKSQPAGAFAEAVPQPAWQRLPSTYILCTEDAAILPGLQRERFAPRLGRTLTLQASHSPFLSCPTALAELIAGLP